MTNRLLLPVRLEKCSTGYAASYRNIYYRHRNTFRRVCFSMSVIEYPERSCQPVSTMCPAVTAPYSPTVGTLRPRVLVHGSEITQNLDALVVTGAPGQPDTGADEHDPCRTSSTSEGVVHVQTRPDLRCRRSACRSFRRSGLCAKLIEHVERHDVPQNMSHDSMSHDSSPTTCPTTAWGIRPCRKMPA